MLSSNNINAPIPYHWTFGWSVENMSNPKPVVNRLLAALIDGNIQNLDNLYRQGATLKETDEATFRRILYHIIDNFDVINWLLHHGMTSDNSDECIGPDGYIWGPIARAWYVKAYDVMELLAYYGFERMSYCINGEAWYIDELIFKYNDIKGVKILKEHGYIEDVNYVYGYPYSVLRQKYPNSKVTAFLNNNPLITRKSVGLDPCSFHEIPKPKKESVGLFHRKETIRRNEIAIADYNDRVRAQKEYIKSFPEFAKQSG